MGWSFDGGDWARIADGRAEFRNADGTWSAVAAPEHAESLSYLTRAVDDPSVDKLVAYQRAGGSLNAEQAAFFSNPLIGLDSFGQGYRWGAIDLFDNAFSPQQAGALQLYGVAADLSPGDVAAGLAFNADQSPAAQAARNGDGWGDFLTIAAIAVAAYFGMPYLAEGAVAAEGTAVAAAASGAGEVSASTWAAFGTEASTASLYSGATASAVNTGVAEYAAAAAAGTATGASTAFSLLPVSSLGPAVSAGFLETALEVAKGVKKAVDTVQIVNQATQQKSIVPRNAPIPAGWAVDGRWSPSLGDTGKFVYDPATGALVMQTTAPAAADAAAVVPATGTVSPLLALAALAGAVFYLVK
jgi:hypothetical protein